MKASDTRELQSMRKTLLYYDQNVSTFIRETRDVDFSNIQNLFLSKLERGALILDFWLWFGARYEVLLR